MYTNQFPRRAVAEAAGLQVEQVFLSPPVSEGAGFTLALPDGLDWADYEEQEEGPPIRTPRPVWDWYRQQYPQLGPEPPTPEEVAAWAPPASEPAPVTDVERNFQKIQERLNSDEAKRTGRPVNPDGAVPLSRAMAATCMLTQGWHYPTEADLETEFNQFLLGRIYEDPTTNTNAGSSTDQKRRALHFTLVMLEGQAFGLDYQAELGAYERTASGAFLAKLALDKRDWLDLPVHTWPSVRAMFADLMG